VLEGRKVAPKDCVIFPLDGVDPVGAALLVEELADYVGYFKIGLGLNSVMGTPQAVQMVHSRGGKAFVDLKINDIPNTVADAVKALSAQGVAMINIHASAEIDAMMEVAKYKGNSIAYAVTVLTSQDEEEAFLSFGMPVKAKVLQFARFAALAGMDGVINSAEELEMLAKHHELDKLLRIVPGIRPKWAPPNDQSRYMTPADAIKAGGPEIKMVIGRPISKPPKEIGSRVDAAKLILEEIASALEACA
jgi:orotidine-5'-phosphate decarboxylase